MNGVRLRLAAMAAVLAMVIVVVMPGVGDRAVAQTPDTPAPAAEASQAPASGDSTAGDPEQPPTAFAADDPAAAEGQGRVRTLFDKLYAGGKIVAVQLLLSVIGLTVVIERFINLRRRNIVPRGLAEQVEGAWKSGSPEAALERARQQPSVMSVAVGALLEHRNEPRSEALASAAAASRPLLRRHIQKAYPIAIIAMLQPLLGLLGTVWGMIGAFDAVALAGAMGNPTIFADEIALALVTTAVGLAVAIPLLGLYHYFKGRAMGMATELEEQLLQLADHCCSREGRAKGTIQPSAAPGEEVGVV